MKTNLSLIGFMGVGKTTVGRALAKKLDMDFIDVDREIERKEARSVAQIFATKGEEYFRNIERNTIKEIKNRSNTVISTGGGAILDTENIKSLQQHSNICLIECDINLIHERVVRRKGKRPTLDCPDAYNKIISLLKERNEIYNDSCDFKIINRNEGIEEIADKIKQIYINEM